MLRNSAQYERAVGGNGYVFVLNKLYNVERNDNRGIQIRSHTLFGDVNVRFLCPNSDAHTLQEFLENLPDNAVLELKMRVK